MDDAVAARGQGRVVRDQQEGRAALGMQREEQVDHVPAGLAIEIAGRLVGQEQRWLRREGAGDGDTLLLAAGKLRRIMLHSVFQTDRFKSRGGNGERIGAAGQLQRYGDILQRGHRRHEMKGLKDDADAVAAKPRQRIFAQRVEIGAGDRDAAAGHALEPAQHHHQRRFAGARRSDQADRRAGFDGRGNAAQNVDGTRRARQGKTHILQEDQRFSDVFLSHLRAPGLWLCGALCQSRGARGADHASAIAFIGAPAAATTRILAFGDSLTAGLGVAPDQAFPVQLAARLKADGYDVTVDNGGVSGDTTAGGLARLDWAMGGHPDVVLLELGANDMLRGLDPKHAETNLDTMLSKLKAAKVKVLLIGMKASTNWGPDYQKDFDAIYPMLAKKYDVPLYPFFLEGVALDPKLNQPDMLHPNPAGVAVIVGRIAPAVEQLLGKPAG